MLRKPLLAQKVVCSEDGREALVDRTAPPTVKKSFDASATAPGGGEVLLKFATLALRLGLNTTIQLPRLCSCRW